MLEYLEQGGNIRKLINNPLIYPPRHVFDEGKRAVTEYLTNYPNSMINAKEITIMLIGRQEAGKTSLGHCLAGKIVSATEIQLKDRTHSFDVYLGYIKDLIFKIIDLGGHKEYESALALLCRDHGLYICLLNPDDFMDDDSLYEGAWIWVEKILDGANSPHFLFVISKIDLIDGKDRQTRINEMKAQLVAFLNSRMGKPLKIRQEREKQLRSKLAEVDSDMEAAKTGNPDELPKLEEQKQNLEKKLSKQVEKVSNPPVFNADSICFVSSHDREGFNELESNLKKAISNLPKVMLQESWKEASDWLLNQNHDKPYVKLDDLKAFAPALTDYDITQMLKTLSIRGSIVWRPGGTVIFHRIEKLAVVMKSLFYHTMQLLLGNFAEFRKLKPDEKDLLIRAYEDGQLPLPLIQSMFVHLHKELQGSAEGLHIGFDDLDFSSTNVESEMLMESLLYILSQLNIIMPMDEKVLGMKMYFIPHLIFKTSDGEDVETFIRTTMTSRPSFKLALCFTSETKICKKTISKYFAMTTSVMQRLASIIDEKLILQTGQDAILVKVSHFEVAVYKPQSPEGNLLKLIVTLTADYILPEMAWIIMNEVSSNDDLADAECQLVCPIDDPDCEHGDYDSQATVHGDSLEEDTRNKRKRIKKLNCDPVYCFPSSLAVKVMSVFHPKEGCCVSPLLIDPNTPGKARADFLETSVILSVIGSQSVERQSIEASIKFLPAFCQTNCDKFSHFVRPVRQHFDDISQCPHKDSCKCKGSKKDCKCKCSLSSEEYLKSFLLLERNSAMVTKGEWTEPLKAIMDKYPEYNQECSSHSCSVTAMVRVARNLVAHETGQVLDDKFWSELRAVFDILVMHSFAAKVDLLHPEKSVLCLFAKAFNEIETKLYSEDKALKPSLPLMRVGILLLDGTQKETVFYFELAEMQKKSSKESNQLEFLRLKVVEAFQLDKNFQGKIIYKGDGNSLMDDIHLTQPTDITNLRLDTRVTHIFHIHEWEIKIQITTVDGTLENTFGSSNTFQAVEKFVSDMTKYQNLFLYAGKDKIKSSESIGSRFKGDLCKLKALNPKDSAQREKLLV